MEDPVDAILDAMLVRPNSSMVWYPEFFAVLTGTPTVDFETLVVLTRMFYEIPPDRSRVQ